MAEQYWIFVIKRVVKIITDEAASIIALLRKPMIIVLIDKCESLSFTFGG